MGDQVTLEFQLPSSNQLQKTPAKVCYARGFRYGFEFTAPDAVLCKRISDFGLQQRTSAFILSANSPMVWITQRMLQQIGVSQVQTGSPKVFPIESPHLIMIDSDWPDFLEVLAFLRSESGVLPVAMVAVLSPTDNAADAHRAGADLVLHKPLALDRTKKVLELAFRLITTPAATEPENSKANGAAVRTRPR
jgi:DNA-binding NtrC family response regulator